MWFKFPEGAEAISVEKQSFVSEYENAGEAPDSDGKRKIINHWFRAPDHFAPTILGLGLGYSSLPPGEKPEGCDVDDLTPTFGAIGAQIGEQAQQIVGLREDLRLANEEIQRFATQVRQADSQVKITAARNETLETENTNLRARIEDFENSNETAEALAAKAAKK